MLAITPWGTLMHESGAAATFDSHRVSPLPGWCTRCGSRGAKWRASGLRSLHVTYVLSDMSRLSRVEPYYSRFGLLQPLRLRGLEAYDAARRTSPKRA